MQSDLTQKPQRPGLVAACLVGPGERQRPLGEGAGLLQVPSQEVASPFRIGAVHCCVPITCSTTCSNSRWASGIRPDNA